MDLDLKYPALSDLRARAKRRMPHFAFEYLDSGTGREMGVSRNRAALDAITFMPDILRGAMQVDVKKEFMGQTYDLPIGIAPVGMSGSMWPGAERKLADFATKANIPYCLSTVAATTPEELSPYIRGNGWFQLYPPADRSIMRDMLKRAKKAGFSKLVITVDVPGESRRERQRRAAISMPPKMRPSILASIAIRPAWALAMLQEGPPRMKLAESYLPDDQTGADAFVHAGRVIRGFPDWDYLREIRDTWEGDVLVKGVSVPEDAKRLIEHGVDGIWVSNHTARQFEAGPGIINQVPKIRAAIGPDVPLIYDSGIIGGLDIMRALALGADYCFAGRAWHYALGALGIDGPPHLAHIFRADLIANMEQIGAETFEEIAGRLATAPMVHQQVHSTV